MAGRPPLHKLMVVLGSGGHTAEMLALVRHLDKAWYAPRTYVVAETDRLGRQKAAGAEDGTDHAAETTVLAIPRSREVGQSYLTSVFTTLVALAAAVGVVWRARPDLVLVNGPGTCVPICAAAALFRLLRVTRSRVVYVESIARTESLSLTGKILYHARLADLFFVQWPGLAQRLPRAVYAGRLF